MIEKPHSCAGHRTMMDIEFCFNIPMKAMVWEDRSGAIFPVYLIQSDFEKVRIKGEKLLCFF